MTLTKTLKYQLPRTTNKQFKKKICICTAVCLASICVSNVTVNTAYEEVVMEKTNSEELLDQIIQQINEVDAEKISLDTNGNVAILDENLYQEVSKVIDASQEVIDAMELPVANEIELPVINQSNQTIVATSDTATKPDTTVTNNVHAKKVTQAVDEITEDEWSTLFEEDQKSVIKPQTPKTDVNKTQQEDTSSIVVSQPKVDTNPTQTISQTDAVQNANELIDSIINDIHTPEHGVENSETSELKYRYSTGNYDTIILSHEAITKTEIYKPSGNITLKNQSFIDYVNEKESSNIPLTENLVAKQVVDNLPEYLKAVTKGSYIELINIDPYIAYIPLSSWFGNEYNTDDVEIYTPLNKSNIIFSKTSVGLQVGYTGQIEFTYKGIPFVFTVADNCQPYLTYLLLTEAGALLEPKYDLPTLNNNNFWKDEQPSSTQQQDDELASIIDENLNALQSETNTPEKKLDLTEFEDDIDSIISNIRIGDSDFEDAIIDSTFTEDTSSIVIYNEDGDSINFNRHITDPITLKPLQYILYENTALDDPNIIRKIIITVLINLICIVAYIYVVIKYKQYYIQEIEEKLLSQKIIIHDGYIDYKNIQNL